MMNRKIIANKVNLKRERDFLPGNLVPKSINDVLNVLRSSDDKDVILSVLGNMNSMQFSVNEAVLALDYASDEDVQMLILDKVGLRLVDMPNPIVKPLDFVSTSTKWGASKVGMDLNFFFNEDQVVKFMEQTDFPDVQKKIISMMGRHSFTGIRAYEAIKICTDQSVKEAVLSKVPSGLMSLLIDYHDVGLKIALEIFAAPDDKSKQEIIDRNVMVFNALTAFIALKNIPQNPDLQKKIISGMLFSRFDVKQTESLLEHVVDMEVKSMIINSSSARGALHNAFKLSNVSGVTTRENIVSNTKFDEISVSYAMEYTAGEPALQKMIIKNMGDSLFTSDLLFKKAIRYSSNDEIVTMIIDRCSKKHLPLYSKKLKAIFHSNTFRTKMKDYGANLVDMVQEFSVALSISRIISDRLGGVYSERNIDIAMYNVLGNRNHVASQTIIDESTTVIPITHSSRVFKNDHLHEFVEEYGGKIPDAYRNFSGAKSINPFMEAVESSSGKTTLWFNNHGGRKHQWLSRGDDGHANIDDLDVYDGISYAKLGDALIKRGNLDELTIILDSCSGYNFAVNLLNYLYEHTSSQQKYNQDYYIGTPNIITASNDKQVSSSEANFYKETDYESYFLYSLSRVEESNGNGNGLTYEHVFKSDQFSFSIQDMAVFVRKSIYGLELDKEVYYMAPDRNALLNPDVIEVD